MMESRVKVAGHPVHPMLVMFPLGLFPTAVIFDLIGMASGERIWAMAAFYMIGAGLIGAAAAAVPGSIDWFAIPKRTRAKTIGLLHGAGNVVLLLLFLISWLLRWDTPDAPSGLSVGLALTGVGLAVVTGWLGGEPVDRLGVGVDVGANLDAPSSLSGPATTQAGPYPRAGAFPPGGVYPK